MVNQFVTTQEEEKVTSRPTPRVIHPMHREVYRRTTRIRVKGPSSELLNDWDLTKYMKVRARSRRNREN